MTTASAVRPGSTARCVVEIASPAQREAIYRMRHAIYATELGQHAENAAGALRDALDERNVYIVAALDGEVAGFVSITPPGAEYSIDKYFAKAALPVPRDAGLYE